MGEPCSSSEATGLVDHFFRHQYGKLVARLCGRFGSRHLEAIEDAVQGALEQALGNWVRRGIPDKPEAWLRTTAQNRLIDHLRRQRRLVEHQEEDARAEEAAAPAFSKEIDDDELRMLFVCADETLAEQVRLVLCLKLLSGFSTREIADRLFLGEANVQKILERGRGRLRDAQMSRGASLETPNEDVLKERLSSVQHVIYLQFTEGHTSHREDVPIREDLCVEALRLAQLLVSHRASDTSSSWALLSLLHFQFARLASRTDERGDFLLLEEQDRSTWDSTHIRMGFYCLGRCGDGVEFSRYHGEAAILSEHCRASSFEETRWDEIVDLYEILERLHPSPLYTLNKAIALSQWKGAGAALKLLSKVTPPTWLARYYLWDGTLGELSRQSGAFEKAIFHLSLALERAPTQALKRVFEGRLARAQKGEDGR